MVQRTLACNQGKDITGSAIVSDLDHVKSLHISNEDPLLGD